MGIVDFLKNVKINKMIYDFKQNQTLEDLNDLGGGGWEVISIEAVSPSNFDAVLMKGKQGEILIESGENSFWIKESITYGEALILILFFLVFMIGLAKIIFNLFFQND